jgi:hypothetical protein
MPPTSSQHPISIGGLDARRRAALSRAAFEAREPQLVALERALGRPGPLWMRRPPVWLSRLRPHIKLQWDAGRGQRFKRLLQYMAAVAPELTTEPWVIGLYALSEVPWVRSPAQWHGYVLAPGDDRFRDLLAHLLLRWEIPGFLADSLYRSDLRHVALLRYVVAGMPMRALPGTTLLPVPLTRRVLHELLSEPPMGECLEEVVRRAQLRGLQAAPWLLDLLITSWLGDHFLSPRGELRWARILAWLVAHQDDLDSDAVVVLMTFLQGVEEVEVRGRTPNSLLREARLWEPPAPELGAAPKPAVPYRASGFRGGEFLVEGEAGPSRWAIGELRSWRALFWEGRKMRHCVATYGQKVQSGRCSIWSLRRDGSRVLTVEVRNKRAAIVQVKGYLNRRPVPHEISVLRTWAAAAGLELS